MLSKCLNPLCSAPFRYLHEGRVFNIDLVSPDHAQEGSRFHRIEHYWLCSSCALHFKVVVEHGQVFTRPLRPRPGEDEAFTLPVPPARVA